MWKRSGPSLTEKVRTVSSILTSWFLCLETDYKYEYSHGVLAYRTTTTRTVNHDRFGRQLSCSKIQNVHEGIPQGNGPSVQQYQYEYEYYYFIAVVPVRANLKHRHYRRTHTASTGTTPHSGFASKVRVYSSSTGTAVLYSSSTVRKLKTIVATCGSQNIYSGTRKG